METIPDALALDLRDFYLESPPVGLGLTPDRIRIKHSHDETPSPRLVIITGEPRRQPGMDGTAFVPVSVEYVTSMDRVTVEDHQQAAGKIDAWWKSIRANKRRAVLSSRVFLHEVITSQPINGFRQDEREKTTTIRGDMMITQIAAI